MARARTHTDTHVVTFFLDHCHGDPNAWQPGVFTAASPVAISPQDQKPVIYSLPLENLALKPAVLVSHNEGE